MASGADPVVAKNDSCWPWMHQWQRWIDISAGKMMDGDRCAGQFIVQERRCNRCEMAQLRTVTS